MAGRANKTTHIAEALCALQAASEKTQEALKHIEAAVRAEMAEQAKKRAA